MKLPPLTLILATTTLASVQITTNPDGSIEAWNAADNEVPVYSFLENQNTLAVGNNAAAAAAAASCCFKGNKCYRAIEGAKDRFGAEFCKKYTKTVFKEPAAMGPFKTHCWNKPQKLSSACSCFAPTRTTWPKDGKGGGGGGGGGGGHDSKPAAKYPDHEPYPPKPTCGPPGSPCTIDNFVEACCSNVNGSVGCSFPAGDPQFGTCFL
ncbi:hypothetical protein B0T21DRAFT_451314 [Apiosordaria backusii]|uniref:Uncharacterized protein n=1 Tax=Apiosordaria backusii TaxID=314023 RepID=A0AA40BLZ5_9PEZI|nr:hypothetical protein B0T21DRAFT_451314 [Apiosordaria backusii]